MKLTNNHNLPEAIVAAIMNDSYTKGDADISVTELLSPPQLRHLKLKHYEELSEDVSDRIWSLLGQSVHTIIERASLALPNVLTEVTINSEYGGWKLKGQVDNVVLSDSHLIDFKVTSAWKVKGGVVPPEWEQQTNVYRRLLAKEKGLVIDRMSVIAVLRDWSRNEAGRSPDYPQAQVKMLDVRLWSEEEADAFINQRVAIHQAEVPALCTDAERWTKPEKWAVMKRGNIRAVKLFDNPLEAQALADTASNLYVEHRPGEAVRCQSWCPVSEFCQQWRDDPRNKQSISETLFNAQV
jgi:hypothetical protein